MRASVCVEVGSRNRENVGRDPVKTRQVPRMKAIAALVCCACMTMMQIIDDKFNYYRTDMDKHRRMSLKNVIMMIPLLG